MRQVLFSSAIIGALLSSLPMYAQSAQTPNTSVPSDTMRTTTTDTVNRNSKDTNRPVTENPDTTNERDLPYYKTHGRGGKYIGIRP
jgi:hypothetical protein